MEEVIRLLELKNQYYEKFYNLTTRFMNDDEESRWKDLELVVGNRQRILNILRTFDYKIARLFSQVESEKTEWGKYRSQVKTILETRTSWVNKIVQVDLVLISLVDRMKTKTIHELKQTVEAQQNLRHFDQVSKKTSKKFTESDF